MLHSIPDFLASHFRSDAQQSPEYANLQPESSPLQFYDRHLDPNLSLKRVVALPLLAKNLTELCDETLFLHSSTSFSNEHIERFSRSEQLTFTDGPSLFHLYNGKIADMAARFASKFYLFTKPNEWFNALWLLPGVSFRQDFHFEVFCEIARGPHNKKYPEVFGNDFIAATQHLMKERLAHFVFLPSTEHVKRLLRNMKGSAHFRLEVPKTFGFPLPSPLPRPADASSGFVKDIVGQKAMSIHAPATRKTRSPLSDRTGSSVTPPRPSKQHRDQRYNPHHYLQSIWTRAVQYDSTFVVFNCGEVERIGIRHRETQTLYLSGPIDPKQSGYGKIHVGLYCAIVTDILDRRPPCAEAPDTSKKRPSEEIIDGSLSRKRPRTRMSSRSEPKQRLENKLYSDLGSLDLALIRLKYEIYNSPTPSSFLRIGPSCVPGLHDTNFTRPTRKNNYKPSEYLDLELSKPISKGSCGTVHRATAKIVSESGDLNTFPLVLKVSYSAVEREKLRNEYKAYEHLARKKVANGIVPVHGLFEDLETGCLAMIMDYGGISLRHRERQIRPGCDQVTMSGPERTSLKESLKAVHRAGVANGDIKPGNTLVDEYGNITLVDFDRAQLDIGPNSQWAEWDWEACRDMMNGEYTEDCYYGQLG